MNTVTLYYIEFVDNGIGVWDKQWFATKEEAEAEYDRKIREDEYDPELDDGSEGGISGPHDVEIQLTPPGLLDFANEYACYPML